MSGDVFGNGMLLSEHIKLVAAFDHRHVFVDPDPDPARTWEERQADVRTAPVELGQLRRESDLRGRRDLPPDAEVDQDHARRCARALGIAASVESLSPAELITACLSAPVDLLWNGGIGTYVKATAESNAQVGDKANDGLRINGNQLRAKCVGEGGNLGLTQLGRIEYANCVADGSTPTSSTTPRASTPPTTRSTSRSCSPARWRPAGCPARSGTSCWPR